MQIVFQFLLSQFQLVQTIVQYIFIGKLAIAPFIQNCAVFYQQQTGVGTYNRLQRNIIHLAEWVFRTGSVTPCFNFLIRRRGQCIKAITMFYAVIIDFIDQINIAVIRFLCPMSYQQESISFIRQHTIGYIFSRTQTYHGKVVNGRFIAFFLQYGTRFNKSPRAVRIIIQCEFLLPAVFFQDKTTFKNTRLRTFGYLHTRFYVHANLIGPEIQHRQILQAIKRECKDKQYGI